MKQDPFDLQRFVLAQDSTYAVALAELAQGRKRSHWMWFVFPQLSGLGASHMARLYAVGSIQEARAYLEHPILGPRLREATVAVLRVPDGDLRRIFGSPDDLKFCSCMTLFGEAGTADEPFHEALRLLCHGQRDPRTIALLSSGGLRS